MSVEKCETAAEWFHKQEQRPGSEHPHPPPARIALRTFIMRRFWGRNDQSAAPRFSRDDDQILALNYENLCDGDYLQRLFVNDPFNSKDSLNNSMMVEGNRGSASSSESALLNPEMAEDLIIFGDSVSLGKQFYNKRLSRELQQSNKFIDSVFLQISRQVLVYEHMSQLMVQRCTAAPLPAEAVGAVEGTKHLMEKPLIFSTLACCLHMIRSSGDWKQVSSSSVRAVMQILFPFLDTGVYPMSWKDVGGADILNEVRFVFLQCVKTLLSTDFLLLNTWNKARFEEEVRRPLFGIFGLLSIGIMTQNADDMIVGTNFLSLLVMIVEERTDRFMQRTKGEQAIALPSSSTGNLKNVPAKVSAKLKQQQQMNVKPAQKGPFGGSVSAKSVEDEIKQPVIAMSAVIETREDLEPEISTLVPSVDMGSKLQTHGSGTKLWDKSIAAKVSLEKEKESGKAKPTKTVKQSEPKLLHEYLEAKDSVHQSPVVINYAITEGIATAPAKNNPNQGSNNDGAVRSGKERAMSGDMSAVSELMRVEREMRDTMQSVLLLPKSVITMLKGYGKSMSPSMPAVVLSPGKKVGLSKAKESTVHVPTSSAAASKVFSCGQNSYGELGLGDVNMRKAFTRITNLDDKGIMSIGAGNEHSLFVTKEGKLITAGYNDNGQCGVGNNQQVRNPTVVQSLEDEEIQHVHVYNGCEHTVAVTKEGKVYAFGYNYRGQLGLGSTNSEPTPRPIRALLSRKVILAACSYHHTVFLCHDGSVFSCGRNDSGQLGHGDTLDKKIPQPVLTAPKNITSISCGQFHTVACTAQGVVYACGKNDYGQLGMEGATNQKAFSKVCLPAELDNIAQVCCGYYHTLVLSTSGVAGGFGRNDYGQLGLGNTIGKIFQCAVIAGLRDKLVVMVSAGCYHSVTVTINGMLYVFGRNNHGQLATGDLDERHAPHPVDDFIGQQVLRVAAGFYHTIVLVHDKKDVKKHSGRLQEACEGDNFDRKLLAETFKKDLALISGPDESDMAVSVNGSASSRSSCRDLLALLIRNINCFSSRADSIDVHHAQDKEVLTGLCATCASLSIMMVIGWQNVKGSSKGSSLPISADDASLLLRNVIALTQRTLKRHKAIFISLLGAWKEKDDDAFDAITSFIQLEENEHTVSDAIILLFGKSFLQVDEEAADGIEQLKVQLVFEFRRIRKILTGIYLATCAMPKLHDVCDVLTSAIAVCLVQSCDVCFGDPQSFSELVGTVADKVLRQSQSFKDTPDDALLPHIRLLAALGGTLHRHEDVIDLFRKSFAAGMEVYHHFLNIYMHFSRVCIDRRLQGHASSKSVDIRRVLTVLELAIATMSKSVMPLVLCHCEDSDGKIFQHSMSMLSALVEHAGSLLSQIIAGSLSEESLGYLRYGTVVPGILPSVLLYCITFAKRGVAMEQLSGPLKNLIQKLQVVGKYELTTARTKANEKKLLTVLSSPPKEKDVTPPGENFNVTPGEAKDDDMNEASVEEILHMKREQHQISWWFRLLKLSVMLSSRMVTLEVRKLRDMFSCVATSVNDAVWDRIADVHLSREAVFGLCSHAAWHHLSWSRTQLLQLSDPSRVQSVFLEDAQECLKSAPVVIEQCRQFRDKEKAVDSVYKMLSQSTQSMFSVNLLNAIEESIFETISIGLEDNSKVKSQRNFHIASNAIKVIYGCRSALVSNSNGMSWVEILLIIAKIVKLFCSFIRHGTATLTLYYPLVLPRKPFKSTRARALWRKAFMVVTCMQRWSNCLVQGYRRLEQDLVNLLLSAVKTVTEDLTVIPAQDILVQRIAVIFSTLSNCDIASMSAAKGLNNVTELLEDLNSITVRSDVINSIAVSIREVVDLREDKSCIRGSSWLCYALNCSSQVNKKGLIASFARLEGAIAKMLKNFHTSTSCTLIELQALASTIRLMEIILLIGPTNKISNTSFTVSMAAKLQVYLHDKYATWNNNGEERLVVRKGASVRDRNFAVKKCIFSLLSYTQACSVRLLSPFPSTARSLHEVLQGHLYLISYLQNTRFLEAQVRSPEEQLLNPPVAVKGDDTKDIPTQSTSSSSSNKSKDTVARKKFQDVIVKPMEFSKNNGGLAILGEKLLNSCKGTDFSIVTWIYLKSRPSETKSVAIVGKFNHSEAWPLVTLKSDGKLEIAYGSNNEIERAVSDEAISPFVWTHLSLVIEPKKIKLFINGVPDIQISTAKSNNRATLFPLVFGSCPANIRTRINNVRDGFDGMLAQCRYYSRGLSPIHVKAIFDNGPPETIDISAKAVYHLLASTKALLLTIDMDYAASLIHSIADMCHTIFVTDTNRRNRNAALDLLQVILSKDCISNLNLSGWRPKVEDPKQNCKVNILDCAFCGNSPLFRSRIVMYFLRIAGWSWLPFVVPTSDGTNSDMLKELCVYSPLTNAHHNVLSLLADSADMPNVEDRTGCQGAMHGEQSFHVISLLHSLLFHDAWVEAAREVVQQILQQYTRGLTDGTTTKAELIDVVGCALLLGGVSSGGYLGAVVRNAFDDAEGRIVNINTSANGATVLSNGPTSLDLKALKVRLTDLTFEDNYYSMQVGDLVCKLQNEVWSTMGALLPRLSLLSKDFLAKCYSDCSFLQKSLLKHLRPIESLLFYKLLGAVKFCTDRGLSSTAAQPVMPQLMAFASAVMEIDFQPRTVSSDASSAFAIAHVTKHWFDNITYLQSVSDKVINLRFPAEAEERPFVEFLSKHMGVAVDQEHKEILNRTGSWGNALVLLASGRASEDTELQLEYAVSDKALTVSGTFELPIDQECLKALQLMHYLRWQIIKLCRSTIQSIPGELIADKVLFPSGLILWSTLCPHSLSDREWVIAQNIADVFNPNQLWNMVSQRIVAGSLALDVTNVLASVVRYMVMSFLRPASYSAAANILTSVDLLPSLLHNLLCWMEFNDSSPDFERIAFNILAVLFPALPYFESEKMELHILQVCVHIVRKLAVRVLDSCRPSTELLELVRSANFSLLRQTAQDQVIRYKNHSFNNISAQAFNLTQLVAYMELVQRRGNSFDCNEYLRSSTGSGKTRTNLMVAKVQSIETAVPKIVCILSTSFEADLSACAATALYSPQTAELLQALCIAQNIDPNIVVVEVALGAGSVGSECIFETVYCGSSTKLMQSGLMPDCVYQMKCRAYFGSTPLSWSPLVEFRTEKGLLFCFDPLKSGPDVVFSDDQLTASYTGDDNWSTLLGSRSFSSGVATWEIRVNQSSTAYLFIGVATSAVDLNTFLGGCSHSWGFIGEQALYHNREKVKVYGEVFSTGDVIGVTLDMNVGTLSFSKNKKNLGTAFDKIYGDLFPAVAFYNLGQELQIMPDGFKSVSVHEPIPISPTRLSMDDVSLVNELILALYLHRNLSHRLAVLVAEHCNNWCATVYVRCRAVSQKDIFLATESPLLKRFGFVVGERVRTYYGVAEVAGSGYNRIWFRVNPEGEVWFFTIQQILDGRAKKQLFTRCSYDGDVVSAPAGASQATSSTAALNNSRSSESIPASTVLSTASYDAATVLDFLEPSKWTDEMDNVLLNFYFSQALAANVEPWQLSTDQLFDNFRILQQQLSRIVMASTELTHRWGIAGPKRKAVIARLGLLRAMNQLLEMYLPFFISDTNSKTFAGNKPTVSDEFSPIIETFQGVGALDRQRQHSSAAQLPKQDVRDPTFESPWPALRLSWDKAAQRAAMSQELWMGPLHAIRRKVFPQLKLKHFYEAVKKSTTRALKTDDDYDYPENLPHVKINRLKSFRAREAAELMQVSGEDLLLSTMFCQLHKELRQNNDEKLRISYTHPMDDGQSRSFKIKFEGEGVDDYGGPYREIFGQVCTELQLLYPGLSGGPGGGKQRPMCFLPLLMPTPNWIADGDIVERYMFMFQPSAQSDMKMDLVLFMGQVVGLALRSRITLDLSLPSFIWKMVVGETLTEKDLASFDQPALEFVQHIQGIYQQYLDGNGGDLSEDAKEAIRDLTWSATLSDGITVDLVPNGKQRIVQPSELGDFLTLYVQARFDENKRALRMFRRGLVSIIPESALSLLTAEDLQGFVCGSKVIDIDRLQNNTEYDDDLSPGDMHILNFWDVLREFNEVEKSAFLRFVWARPSLPPAGVDFTQKMRVLSATGEETTVKHDQFLPKAHTCFFSINLPKYSTKEVSISPT